MEDRLITGPRRTSWLPVAALGLIVAITAGWWALALWPTAATPQWLARTREVCFGSGPSGLPSAGGWVLLIGEPLGMLGVLLAVWGRQVGSGLRALGRQSAGRVALGGIGVALAVGLTAAVIRVQNATAEPASRWIADSLPGVASVDRPAPPLALADQSGTLVELTAFQGRPVLVSFAFAHCTTVCPAQVQNILAARRRAAATNPALRPAVVIVTVDPWRDPPSRLPAIALAWQLGSDEHVLSGTVDEVQATLASWRIRTERDTITGDIAHPATVYLIGRNGRIAGLGLGSGRGLAAAVERM